MKKINLKPGKEQSLKRFHPWVFSGAIDSADESLNDGDDVLVFSSDGDCLGTGHYQDSSIAVRMYHFDLAEPDSGFWKSKLEKALRFRVECGIYDSSINNVFRLVNAEGDGFPGLIADYYNGSVVLQAHSVGMCKIIAQLASALKEIFNTRLDTVYDKSSDKIRSRSGIDKSSRYIIGKKNDTVVKEHGKDFIVNWAGGQKTGFFIDQRENRKLLEQYSSGKSVLNMFAYTGGFSVYALSGDAIKVDTVDSSGWAVKMAEDNINMNFPGDSRSNIFCSEVFKFFNENRQLYDIIVIDPPAFAKSRRALRNAVQAYKRLNIKAVENLAPGGLLFTFSCSQVVGRDNFLQAVYSAALQSGRDIKILHRLSQPADHPVSIFHPEGEYLKGLVLQVF